MKIAVIDYNAGNIASVANALERLGYAFEVSRDPKIILAADKVIFPGQGRAAPAMKDLRESGLDEVLRNVKVPFLGVCLGMQLLFEFSEEDETECLGIIPGHVTKFKESDIKIPQMGWNTVVQKKQSSLFTNVPDTFYAYFANSYFAAEDGMYTLASTHYGNTSLSAIIQKDNYYGTQFHPEKSSDVGMRILKNFCELDSAKTSTLILPAIDIIGGKCVRLFQGDYDKQTTYDASPPAQAQQFVESGAKYLHIIDLEGAKAGSPQNADAIISLAQSVAIPVQTGGGIRTIENAKRYLENGIARIILSTSAISDPEMVRTLITEYGPSRIVISIDARDEKVAIKGWQEESSLTVEALLEQLHSLGITTIIYTDIKSDGTLKGPNYEALQKMLTSGFKIMAAGGISTIEDVEKLDNMGIYGAVVGKALYEGAFDLAKALQYIPQPDTSTRSVQPTNNVSKRVIACMDIANGRVVKGAHFKNLRDAGDPVELGRLYSDNGADELVFLDINATVENRKTLYDLVRDIARTINIPFTVGGGVNTIADIKRLLEAGADKVSIGSAAVTSPSFVEEAAREFGSQCIVVSVDPKQTQSGWEMYIKGGREATGVDALEFCKEMQTRGAGELLVNSLDRDGTEKGYDIELLRAMSNVVSIPVIASSGAGKREHFLEAIIKGRADAVLAATLFHYQKIAIPDLKKYLSENSIAIRL